MRVVLGLLALAGLALSNCQKMSAAAPTAGAAGPRGRYVAVGTYAAGQLWAHLALPKPATEPDPIAARLDDDEQIIAAMDSATGEVRRCGNLSGHCLTFSPWSAETSTQGAPAALLKHAQDLNREAAAGRAATGR